MQGHRYAEQDDRLDTTTNKIENTERDLDSDSSGDEEEGSSSRRARKQKDKEALEVQRTKAIEDTEDYEI